MTDQTDLKAQAARLRELHHGEDLLVLPNVWDAASAAIVAEAGFPAVATASNAIAAMLGYPDGEGAPSDEMFAAAGRVVRAVNAPTTVDAEAGYGMEPAELVDRLLEIGAVGCNLEDTDHQKGGFVDAEKQAAYLAAVRAAAEASGVPIVINARVDMFLFNSPVPEGERLPEAVRRGRLYLEAGADCIYPIMISNPSDITTLVRELAAPINANPSAELDLPKLRELGVARVSYGPGFYRTAMAGFESAVKQLRA